MPYSAPALEHDLWLRSRRVRSDRSQALNLRLLVLLVATASVFGFSASILRSHVLQPTLAPTGPAPTGTSPPPDEQRYLAALRPIHSQLELNVVQMGLGAAVYRANEIDRAELREHLEDGLAAYRQAEQRMQVLQPPPSLRAPHEGYLATVRLLQRSAIEMLKMYEDGDEEHLSAALPLSLECATRMRELDDRLWPVVDRSLNAPF